MAFPVNTTVLDTFTGTNGDDLSAYSSNWSAFTDAGECEIQGNAATCITDTVASVSIWQEGTSLNANCEASLVLSTLPDGGSTGMLLRISSTTFSTADGYWALWNPAAGGVVGIYRVDDGTATLLTDFFLQSMSAGDGFGFDAIGSTLTAYRYNSGSWSSVGSRTDSTYSAGGVSVIYTDDTTTRMDSWITGNKVYTLTASDGTYAISGTAANLEYHYALTASGGTYAISGTTANLERHSLVTAEGGSYAISGTEANLEKHSTVSAEGGSYTITPTDASLIYSRIMPAAGARYAISGTAAKLERHS